jgi:hypothetical protein
MTKEIRKNDEIRMSNDERMTNPETRISVGAAERIIRHSSFGFLSDFVIRHSSFAGVRTTGLLA